MEDDYPEKEKEIQQLKEELEILENLYPNRLHPLKLHLQSFISTHNTTVIPTSSSATTQVSSSNKKEQRKNYDGDITKAKEATKQKRKDRTDMVLEKAHSCLLKIRNFKSSLC